MPQEYAQLRNLVLDYLRRFPKGGEANVTQGSKGILDFAQHKGLRLDDSDRVTIQRVFHDLYLERVIMTGHGPDSANHAMGWPFYRITPFGKKVLETQEYVPYDPDGYLARLKKSLSPIDPDIVRYLEEALGCFRADHLLAAAVMTGCAAEKGLLLLVEDFRDALQDPAKKAKFVRETEGRFISQQYDALWKRLEPIAGSLPFALGDDLHVILDRVFHLIRTTRNHAGHPTGKLVERETVHANFILFPSYCRRVYGLMEHFRANPIP